MVRDVINNQGSRALRVEPEQARQVLENHNLQGTFNAHVLKQPEENGRVRIGIIDNFSPGETHGRNVEERLVASLPDYLRNRVDIVRSDYQEIRQDMVGISSVSTAVPVVTPIWNDGNTTPAALWRNVIVTSISGDGTRATQSPLVDIAIAPLPGNQFTSQRAPRVRGFVIDGFGSPGKCSSSQISSCPCQTSVGFQDRMHLQIENHTGPRVSCINSKRGPN